MAITPDLITLAQQLAGCYDNRTQAIAEPIWYVPLIAWWRPVPLFAEDSFTFFLEQANINQVERPYRQRLVRLREQNNQLQAQFYQFEQPSEVLGAGQNPQLVQKILTAEIQVLTGCQLAIQRSGNQFSAFPSTDRPCEFTFPEPDGNRKIGQVKLGFVSGPDWVDSHDIGINPETGKAIWGAMMGPYRFQLQERYAITLNS